MNDLPLFLHKIVMWSLPSQYHWHSFCAMGIVFRYLSRNAFSALELDKRVATPSNRFSSVYLLNTPHRPSQWQFWMPMKLQRTFPFLEIWTSTFLTPSNIRCWANWRLPILIRVRHMTSLYRMEALRCFSKWDFCVFKNESELMFFKLWSITSNAFEISRYSGYFQQYLILII